MSGADGTSMTPAGWYPDPANDTQLRRWDGQQWTQDVLLAPAQAPAPPAQAPAPPAQPPVGQPVPASPPPSVAPPGSPTVPRPSPPVNQHPNTQSGPVTLPEWATLPGLTLPPDLSSLPGMESDSILPTPTFVEPEQQRASPTPPVFEPPFIPQRPDVQSAGAARGTAPNPPPAAPPLQPAPPTQPAPPPSATPYAPPPSGAQYDVPPPPGMAHVPTSGAVLPPSAFVAPQMPAAAWPQLPPVASAPAAPGPGGPTDLGVLPRTVPNRSFETATGSATVSSWLIGVLPLLQFAVVYVVFGVLGVTLAPGMQWGILAAPAAFSLLFANADRKKLADLGFSAPSIVLGLIAPLYLLVRCFTTGRSSVPPLVAWIVLQAGAVAGVYYLLPSVLAAAIRAIG